MIKNVVYMYVHNKLADWEWGYVTAELHTGRFFKKGIPAFSVKTFGLNKEPIITMGGVRIYPDLSVNEIKMEDCALLLLPGGETWFEPQHAPVLEKAKEVLVGGVLVAAICGATLALAGVGVLDEREHTSNDLAILQKMCPNYKGEKYYKLQSAVTDGNLITAGGIAPLEFAYHVIKKLDVFSEEVLYNWYHLHKTQENKYFFQLIKSHG